MTDGTNSVTKEYIHVHASKESQRGSTGPREDSKSKTELTINTGCKVFQIAAAAAGIETASVVTYSRMNDQEDDTPMRLPEDSDGMTFGGGAPNRISAASESDMTENTQTLVSLRSKDKISSGQSPEMLRKVVL